MKKKVNQNNSLTKETNKRVHRKLNTVKSNNRSRCNNKMSDQTLSSLPNHINTKYLKMIKIGLE
jgi:hypothetical protein